MALIYIDRVLETSTTTGVGTYALAGAITGYQAVSGIGNANTGYFCSFEVDSNGNASGGWEVFLGTYATSGNTLARTSVLKSTNSNNAVSWSAGTRRIMLVHPADVISTLLISGGALGTPSSGTLTSCTGLPISTGVSGLGANIATALASALNGSGAVAGTTSPVFVTPTLGVASATSVTAPTLIGSDSSGGNLTLKSTSHATKGKVYLNTAQTVYVDDVTNYVRCPTVTNVGDIAIGTTITGFSPRGTVFDLIANGSAGATVSSTGTQFCTKITFSAGDTAGNAPDSGLSRTGAAAFALGTSTAGNATGTLALATEIIKISDAVTNSITNVQIFGHNSSGTPAAGFGVSQKFQLESSTTEDTEAGLISVEWVTATHASRKARLTLSAYDTAVREGIRVEASGTVVMLGFFGASAVIQQAGTGEATGFTAGAGTPVNDDSTFTGNVGSTAYRINDIVKALKNLGLLAQ